MKKAHKWFIISLLGLGVCSNQVQANNLTFSAIALREAKPLQKQLANSKITDLVADFTSLKKVILEFQSNLLACFSRVSPNEKKQYQSLQTALQNLQLNGMSDLPQLKQAFKLLPKEISDFLGKHVKDPIIKNFLGL